MNDECTTRTTGDFPIAPGMTILRDGSSIIITLPFGTRERAETAMLKLVADARNGHILLVTPGPMSPICPEEVSREQS